MRVALILPGSIWYAPYVRIYTRLLKCFNIDHSIISWNREGDDNPEGFQYNVLANNGHNSAGLKAYLGYVKYIKTILISECFDRLIIFGPQMTCLLSTYLLKNYKGRYLIDYRDLSIEQKIGFKQLFSIMLKYSFANVVSSPGFIPKLPKRDDYYLSHNFDVTTVKNSLIENDGGGSFDTDSIDVLTIGAIRDYSSNIEVVKSLGNKDYIQLRFIGKGDAAQQIEQYCIDNDIKNITFKGFYKKEDELNYVKDATFMNIFYPRVVTHDTALSNRFYISLLNKKPMIVTKNTTQGDYAEKYNVGIALEDCSNLEDEMRNFLLNDYDSYAKRCNALLNEFIADEENFQKIVQEFIKQP